MFLRKKNYPVCMLRIPLTLLDDTYEIVSPVAAAVYLYSLLVCFFDEYLP